MPAIFLWHIVRVMVDVPRIDLETSLKIYFKSQTATRQWHVLSLGHWWLLMCIVLAWKGVRVQMIAKTLHAAQDA